MIKYILWDIDNTLLNFDLAEEAAMKNGFEKFAIDIKDENAIEIYNSINDKYWKRLEKGEINRHETLHGRFREFFDLYNVNYDEKFIENYNIFFQEELGKHIFFNDGARETLEILNRDYDQYAVTNGSKIAQKAKLSNSGLDKIFLDAFISEDLKVDKPSKEFFDKVFNKIGSTNKDEYILIGDSLSSDMRGANNAGIKNIWYNPKDKENNLGVNIDYTIHELDKVIYILDKLK